MLQFVTETIWQWAVEHFYDKRGWKGIALGLAVPFGAFMLALLFWDKLRG